MTWMAWARYDDIGKVLELGATYDDALKKNKAFTDYGVLVANRICMELELYCKATYGKWGARLEPNENPALTNDELEEIANKIINHPSWKALKESTRIFTFGNEQSDRLMGDQEEEGK